MTFDKFIKAYIELRPKPHNRNSLIILLCGIGLASNTIWYSVVAAFAKEYIGVEISSLQNETTVSGIAVIIIGVVYHYFSEKLAVATRQNSENDKVAAARFWKIYEERHIDFLIGHDLWNGFISTSDDSYLDTLLTFFESTEDTFNLPSVENERKNAGKACRELVVFNAYHFFYRRGNLSRDLRYLYPDLNFELDGQYSEENANKFDKFMDQLHEKIDNFDRALKNFALSLKRHDLGRSS